MENGNQKLFDFVSSKHIAEPIRTTFTWPTEYSSTIVNTVIANLSEKLCDRSQNIHLSRTASSSIKMELIQINAVKNSSNKIKVRGNADT